ncbi:hypothetical protein Hanom_Chr16g01453631 [Helianthus anomalus]
MVNDEEMNEDVDEDETKTKIFAEGFTAEPKDVNEPVIMSPPPVVPVTTTDTADHPREDPAADLPPRKRSRRNPRINNEVNVEVETTTDTSTPTGTSQPKFNYILSELNPKIIEFMSNERAVMYMPVPKPGEGSNSGPSEADVIRVAKLLQAAASQVEAAAKSKHVVTPEAAESSDSEDLFEENETTILMRRNSTLEEEKIFKDAQIASLMEELVVKNQEINELETNLGALSAVVMDIKQKLEGNFPKEFANPPKESTAEEREQQRKEHKDAMNRYFENPPRMENRKPGKKMVVTRYVITTEKSKHGNRSGITSWAYNDEKGIFIVLRKNRGVEYYDNSEAFESWTVVDLREISKAGYHDQTKNPNCKIGWNFFNRPQQQARVNFRDMKLTQSTIEEDEELPDNTLKNLKFWIYDPVSRQAVIVCEDAEYRFLDTRDLMCFGENGINLLAKTQIQSDPQYEVCAKSWTGVVAQIMNFKLWSGQRTRVETQLFGPYIGRSIPILRELQRKKKEQAKMQSRKRK